MVIIMAKSENPEIEWKALDMFWAEQYEADYGCLFISSVHTGINLPAPLIEATD